jgi:hypothetical protein
MSDNVVRIADYERRSREPDAVSPRDPVDAAVIVLPVVRVDRAAEMTDVYTRTCNEAFP